MTLEQGIELMRAERWFDAHEALEDDMAGRAGPRARLPPGPRPRDRRLASRRSRGNASAASRQLEKATRRLAPYAPEHRGVDVTSVLGQVEAASARVAEGLLDLLPVRI